jgi:hypothetical protein
VGNTYECDRSVECTYWDAIHGLNGRSIYDQKFKERCSNCSRPTRERFAGHGIYPPKGGFTLDKDA